MASTMDALQSFVHLDDSVPSWLSRLDALTVSVAEHNARFIEMARVGSRLLKKNNPSTESLRHGPVNHYAVEGETAAEDADIYVPPNPTYQCISYASRAKITANNNALVRKRKASNASPISGQPRYRTKSLVVVYYDSAVQESFHSLFRSIAGARNNLRKGKTDASFKAHMASLGVGGGLYTAAGEVSMPNLKVIRSGVGFRTPGPDFSADNKLSTFDQADKDLEITQSLCEVAAHQFLRDGDCRSEIEGMRKRFDNCQAIANREVERLKEEEAREQEEKDAAAKPVQEEQLPVVQHVEAKVHPPPPLMQSKFAGTGVIEIDDGSDAESVHIDFFRTRVRRV